MSDNGRTESIPIVLDNGSGNIKAGFSGAARPSIIFPTVVGRPRGTAVPPRVTNSNQYIGKQALVNKDILTIHHSIEHGIITNWDDMEKIWYHTFYEELHVVPEEHPLLITEASLNPKANRDKMAQILFEQFNVSALYVANQAVLSFYTSGTLSGIVLQSGDGVTDVIPVYQGHAISHATDRLDFAGRDLTDWMVRLLAERGYSFASTAEREIVRDIKEKLSYVALEFEQELVTAAQSESVEQNYQLPDGQEITIGNERFRCAEALFRPTLVQQPIPGIAQFLHNTIMKCDIDQQDRLCRHIIVSGGTTMMPGFTRRLKKEMETLTPMATKIRIIADSEREYTAWIGGSMLTSLSTFEKMWISRREYNERGPSVMYRQ